MKKKIIEIFAKKGIFISEDEIENLAEAIQDTLDALADRTEDEEPYAKVTIAEYRGVSGSVVAEMMND